MHVWIGMCVRLRRASPHQKIHLEVIWSVFLKVREKEGGKKAEEEMRECLDLKASGRSRDYYLIALRLSNLTSAM